MGSVFLSSVNIVIRPTGLSFSPQGECVLIANLVANLVRDGSSVKIYKTRQSLAPSPLLVVRRDVEYHIIIHYLGEID